MGIRWHPFPRFGSGGGLPAVARERVRVQLGEPEPSQFRRAERMQGIRRGSLRLNFFGA